MTEIDRILAALTDKALFLEKTLAAVQRQEQLRRLGVKPADVASAGTITLGQGNFVDVTGVVAISYITKTGWTSGSIIILQFDSAPTLTHNAGAPPAGTAALQLAGSVNFGASSGDTITLAFDGTFWREVARTII